MKHKLLSVLTALALVLTLLPTAAFAVDTTLTIDDAKTVTYESGLKIKADDAETEAEALSATKISIASGGKLTIADSAVQHLEGTLEIIGGGQLWIVDSIAIGPEDANNHPGMVFTSGKITMVFDTDGNTFTLNSGSMTVNSWDTSNTGFVFKTITFEADTTVNVGKPVNSSNTDKGLAIKGTTEVTNNGTITVAADGELSLADGTKLTNAKTITNNGTLDNAGTIEIDGTGALLTNSGTLNNETTTGTITVTKGTLANAKTLTNHGTIEIAQTNGALTNSGTLNNETTTGVINVTGTLTNGSTLKNDGTLTVKTNGTLNNNSTLSNNKTLAIENEGALTNSGTITNKKTDGEIDITGTLTNTGTGTITNNGTIDVKTSTGKVTNNGTIDTSSDGTYKSGASTVLEGNGKFKGAISNIQDATVTGNVFSVEPTDKAASTYGIAVNVGDSTYKWKVVAAGDIVATVKATSAATGDGDNYTDLADAINAATKVQTVTTTNTNLTLYKDATLVKGAKLVISTATTFEDGKTFTNEGDVTITAAGSLTNYSDIISYGTLTIEASGSYKDTDTTSSSGSASTKTPGTITLMGENAKVIDERSTYATEKLAVSNSDGGEVDSQNHKTTYSYKVTIPPADTTTPATTPTTPADGTTTNADGSTTTTTTAADGTVTQTTTGADGSTTETVTKPDGSSTTTAKEADGTETVKVVDNAKTFTDTIPVWAEDSVDFVTAREIFNGDNNGAFQPTTTATRGTIAQVLFNFDKDSTAPAAEAFADAEGKWYDDAANWANSVGVVTGGPDGSFNGDAAVTRQDLALMLYRYAQTKGYDTTKTTSLAGFTDSANVAGYAEAAMQWAVANGIITGNGEGVNPTGSATRAEVATMLARFVNYASK